MNEEDRISRKMLIMILVLCIVTLAAVIGISAYYSPKVFTPSFSGIEDEEIPVREDFSENQNGESGSVFPIGINTATAEDLQQIPDIGPATAKLIINYREEHGTIVAFRELLSINGIGEKTVELLKEYCIIN